LLLLLHRCCRCRGGGGGGDLLLLLLPAPSRCRSCCKSRHRRMTALPRRSDGALVTMALTPAATLCDREQVLDARLKEADEKQTLKHQATHPPPRSKELTHTPGC
jgi:hypothetical protein